MSQEELKGTIDHFYKLFIEKLSKYYPKYQKIAHLFEELETKFYSMPIKDKVEIIKKMIVITQANPSRVDIKEKSFMIGSSLGRLSGKKVNLNNTIFYDVSVTGLYCKKYKL